VRELVDEAHRVREDDGEPLGEAQAADSWIERAGSRSTSTPARVSAFINVDLPALV
jgi:hypothetical protein